MAIKQVVCSICNETVNKAQTLSIGDDKRACRKHSEITEQAVSAQQKLKEQADARREAEKPKPFVRQEEPASTEIPTGRCFSCSVRGYRQDVFHMEMLICTELYRMKHGEEPNLFDPVVTKKLYAPMKGLQCLWVIEYQDRLKLDYNGRCAAQIMGFAAMCTKCCEKQNVTYKTGSEDLTFDQLVKASMLYEIARPQYTEIAKERLEA